ncbi:hypothetical protein F5883DRAFT_651164 [Diaporthe sp. PMI_573]|nr:hypothetical protein F5883DRAFT_651164 [Diaporthaceae sp. PMI_573]
MQNPVRHALLIGVDFYYRGIARGPGIEYRNLRGCCNDVDHVAEYLKNVLKVENITKLTATCDPRNSNAPIEVPWRLPTRHNVLQHLEHICNIAKPGDLVYIHFSGHGTRRGTLDAVSNPVLGDRYSGTALVMTDVQNSDAVHWAPVGTSRQTRRGGQYLTGYDLGVYVRRMMQTKAVRVLIVLDSCFSGAGLRHGQEEVAIRGAPHEVDTSFLTSDEEAEEEIDQMTRLYFQDDYRDLSSQRKDWIMGDNSPLRAARNGCVVLTASAIDQRAAEGPYGPGGIWQGALTSKMLIRLKVSGAAVLSYEQLHRQLLDGFRTMQTPRIHGPIEYGFFSNTTVVDRQISHIKSTNGTHIDLDVGRAQGVFVGATYYVIPFDYGTIQDHDMEMEARQGKIVKATVESAEDLFSKARLHQPLSKPPTHCVLRDWALKDKTLVRLQNFPPSMHTRSALQNEIEKTHNLSTLVDESDRRAVKFTVEARGLHYVINRHNPWTRTDTAIRGLPAIRLGDLQAGRKLGMIIRHVARYWEIQGLRPSPATGSPEQVNIIPAEHIGILVRGRKSRWDREFQVHMGPDGVYPLIDGWEYDLKLSYTGTLNSAYIAVFAANTSWAIEKLQPDYRGTEQIEARTTISIPRLEWNLDANIPEGHIEANDTLVLFISSHPEPLWDGIELEKLPADIHRDCGEDDVLIPDPTYRIGDKDKQTRLANLNTAQGIKPMSWGVVHYKFRTTRI